MKKPTTCLLPAALAGLVLAAGSAHGASVLLVDTDSVHTASNSAPGDFTLTDEGPGNRDGIYSYSYSAGASFDMLVVTMSREASSASQNGGDTFSVSYANEGMDLATGSTAGSGVSIYYLETSAQSGTIALDFTGFTTVNGIGIGIAAIKSDNGDPIALTDADSAIPAATSITIVPTLDESFSMFAVDTNGGNFGDLSPNQIDKVLDIGSNGFAAGYDTDVAAGSITYSYSNTVNPRGIAAANFTVIPEPSAVALLGLGGLFLLRRRR